MTIRSDMARLQPVKEPLPPLAFDWLEGELPAGPWPEALRKELVDALKSIGWQAVADGEFFILERLYGDFVSIFPRILIDASDVDRAADLYTLMHIMLWRRTQILSDLLVFNRDVVQPFTAFLDRIFPKLPVQPSTRRVPRIAYLSETSELFGSNAVARITVSLMLGQHELRSEADRPVLYCINQPAASLIAFAAEHGLQVRDVARPTPTQSVEAVLSQLRADEIDVLIADSNCAVATMVMQRRPVAVQAFHENGFAPWAIAELDLALLGITRPCADLFRPGVAIATTPRNTAAVFQKMPRDPADVAELKQIIGSASGVARPSIVYGCYGRMGKITADYMARVDAILAADPDAIFFAGGTGCITPIVDRLDISPASDRMVIYNDFIDGHLVGDCIDVFLDTDPFPGGMSCVEVQARGVPVVWMAPHNAAAPAIIGDQRDPALMARDADDYVRLALSLRDGENRTDRGRAAEAIARRFADMREQAELVEQHIATAWARARHIEEVAA